MQTPPDETATSLRSNRDFQAVLWGQAVSAFGDAISITATPLLVLFLTGSGALMGAVGALQLAPDLVGGLLAGALADRWDRRRMMLWTDAGRAVLTAFIPVSYWLGLPTMAVVLAVSVPIGALRVLSDAAYASAIPKLVGRENIARASSYLEATLSVPFIVGPALAGVLVGTIGAPATIAIDAGSFAFSAASLVFVRRSLRAERPPGLPKILTDIREGIVFAWRTAALRSVIAYWCVMTFATASMLPALAFYLTVDRREGAELFGVLGSVWSGGYLVGSLVAGRLPTVRLGVRMLAGGVVIGAGAVVIAGTSAAPIYLLAAALIGGGLAVQLVAYMTIRMSITPDVLLGRVGSTARTIARGVQLFGLLAGGALLDATDGRTALFAMGGACIVGSLALAASRSLRRPDVDPTVAEAT